MIKQPEKQFEEMVLKAKQGDRESIADLFGQVRPFLDRVIRKLGEHPGNGKVFGMDYAELMAEAQSILLINILPNYDPGKGEFLRYFKKYLAREIPKRLFRARKRLKRDVPFTDLEKTQDKEGSSVGQVEDRESIGLLESLDRDLDKVELSIALERVSLQLDPMEKEFMKELLDEGRFPPVRQKAKKINVSPSTIWRKRRGLIRKIVTEL